jgi:hypothetical protein
MVTIFLCEEGYSVRVWLSRNILSSKVRHNGKYFLKNLFLLQYILQVWLSLIVLVFFFIE